MILIAQPKSASSSLVKTLGEINNSFGHVGVKASNSRKYEEFKELNKYHTTLCFRPLAELLSWQNSEKFYKEHVIPIPEQLQQVDLLNKNFVVLLRTVKDSVDSYRRFGIDHNYPNIDLAKIEKELELFQKNWIEYKNPYKMVVWFDDLILDYDNAIKKIIKHYGLKDKKVVELHKVYYKGVGRSRIIKG